MTTMRDVSKTSWWIVDRVVGAGKRRVLIIPVKSSKTHRHRGRITVKSTLFFFFLVPVVDAAFVVHHHNHFQYQLL
jgi:hypothetical protein